MRITEMEKQTKETYKNIQKNLQKSSRVKPQTQKGITLLALVITIIVLLILAGITISSITSENGIIQNAISAKERAEIDSEREIVEQATVQAMGNNKRGNIVRNELQDELDKITGEGKTIVTADTEEGGYFVKFVDSGRIYKVSIDGDVEYLGKEDELITQADIIANPESNTTPELIQQVDLTVKTPIEIEGAEYSLVYAWNQDKENAPEDTEFLEATLIGNGRIRTTTVFSSDTVGGDYYLWVRVVVGEIEREVCFGPYTIRDHTTLVSTDRENQSTSGFLGSKNQEKESVKEIERGLIESINITTSLAGHSISDENTWDVSQSQNGMYLAWYEDSDNDGYYEVTIAGDGGVVANSNSSHLFANIGYGVENQEVTITGLENLETGLVTNMSSMFNGCKGLTELDVSSFDTSNVTNMESMFAGCSNLVSIDLSNFKTDNVTSMSYMFDSCSNVTELDLSNFNTSNVTYMRSMFSRCSNVIELDVSNFDTSNVTDMYSMFSQSTKLTSLDVSNFNTGNVTNMGYMFYYCNNLKTLDLSNFNAQKVTNMTFMFAECHSLESINLSGFNTTNVNDMSWMFQACMNLKEINFGETFYTDNVTSMHYMFQRCNSLSYLDLSNFNMQNVTSWGEMFTGVPSTIEIKTSIDTENWIKEKFPNLTNIHQ